MLAPGFILCLLLHRGGFSFGIRPASARRSRGWRKANVRLRACSAMRSEQKACKVYMRPRLIVQCAGAPSHTLCYPGSTFRIMHVHGDVVSISLMPIGD